MHLLQLLNMVIIYYLHDIQWAFWAFFGSLLGHILNDIEHNFGLFLVFWACFIIFFKP
jgi:hypothetical protein